MTNFNINGINPNINFNQNIGSIPNFAKEDAINNFENILQQQQELLAQNMANAQVIKGGINFDNDLFNETQKVENLSSAQKTANNFGEAFTKGLNSVNAEQIKSQNLTMAFAAGEDVSVHDVMIQSQKANLSMSMAMQIRNKLLNAYSEIYSMRF